MVIPLLLDEDAPFNLGSLSKLLKDSFSNWISVLPAMNSLFFKSKKASLKNKLFECPFKFLILSLKNMFSA